MYFVNTLSKAVTDLQKNQYNKYGNNLDACNL